MTRRRRWSALVCVLVIASMGCDVSSPLIDRLPEPPKPPDNLGYIIQCRELGPCGSSQSELVPTIPAPFRLEWAGCAQDGCDDPSAMTCSHEDPLEQLAGADQDCVSKRFIADDGTPRTIELNGVEWKDSNIALRASKPIEIVLSASKIEGVRIVLEGPITLRFQEETSLEGTGISSPSPESRVTFDHAMAVELTLGDADQRFAGELVARHTSFEQSSMLVESASFDSVAIVAGHFAAEELSSRDGFLKDVVLALGDAVFAPTEFDTVHIERCSAISIFGSYLWNVRIPSCSGDATRLYESTLVHAWFDGELSADTSKIETTYFGLNDPTTVLLWATHIMSSAFCDYAQGTRVEVGGVTCNICSDAFNEAAPVCFLPQDSFANGESPTGRYNGCEALDEAQRCGQPLPDRPRPHTNEP